MRHMTIVCTMSSSYPLRFLIFVVQLTFLKSSDCGVNNLSQGKFVIIPRGGGLDSVCYLVFLCASKFTEPNNNKNTQSRGYWSNHHKIFIEVETSFQREDSCRFFISTMNGTITTTMNTILTVYKTC